jgi:predicted GTPase
MTHALADRKRLEIELDTAPGYDVLVTEVKAAAVDVAVRIAAGRGIDVVFADNELVGDGIGEAFDRLLTLAAAHG